MQANHLNGYLIMPNQILTIPNGGSGSDQVVQQLKLAVIILHLHSTIKTYTLKVNAHGMCSTNVHKLVNLSVLTGLMQNTGRQMQRMMVIKLIILHLLIMQSTPGPYGHVAYVERINGDGSILISEMNYANGPYNMNYRTIPASEVSSYAFIH